jgi:hypothetical protein
MIDGEVLALVSGIILITQKSKKMNKGFFGFKEYKKEIEYLQIMAIIKSGNFKLPFCKGDITTKWQ